MAPVVIDEGFKKTGYPSPWEATANKLLRSPLFKSGSPHLGLIPQFQHVCITKVICQSKKSCHFNVPKTVPYAPLVIFI